MDLFNYEYGEKLKKYVKHTFDIAYKVSEMKSLSTFGFYSRIHQDRVYIAVHRYVFSLVSLNMFC